MTARSTTARRGVVRADDAVSLLEGPLGALLLAGHRDTQGPTFVIHDLAPRALGSPMHTHSREDEWSFVLSGRVGAQVGDSTSTAGPGDLILKPRAVPHAFWNAGDDPARLLEVITPGGLEDYFRALAEVLAVDGPPDLARIGEVAGRFGLDVDPGSIPELAATHGLVLR